MERPCRACRVCCAANACWVFFGGPDFRCYRGISICGCPGLPRQLLWIKVIYMWCETNTRKSLHSDRMGNCKQWRALMQTHDHVSFCMSFLDECTSGRQTDNGDP